MTYNLTGIVQNGTGIVEFTQMVNQHLMFYWFGTLMLIGIGTILFMSFMFRTNDAAKSISAAMFISFGLSLLLGAMSLVPPLVIFICLIGAGASIAFTWKTN